MASRWLSVSAFMNPGMSRLLVRSSLAKLFMAASRYSLALPREPRRRRAAFVIFAVTGTAIGHPIGRGRGTGTGLGRPGLGGEVVRHLAQLGEGEALGKRRHNRIVQRTAVVVVQVFVEIIRMLSPDDRSDGAGRHAILAVAGGAGLRFALDVGGLGRSRRERNDH